MAKVETSGIKVVATNRKAYHDYAIEDTLEAGLVLIGSEIKSIRAGRVNLRDSYATIRDGEVWLLNAHIAPYDPKDMVGSPMEPPSSKHLLGTNDMGVDVLSELIFAGRISLTVGLITAAIIMISGSLIGLISGYFGGIVDEILMRITDTVLVLPRLPLMIVIGTYLGPGLWTIIFVYSIVGWSSPARQIRSQVLVIKENTFIEASKAIGAGNSHIIFSHILPNVMGIIVANGVMEIMFAILVEAGLSFLFEERVHSFLKEFF